LRLLVTGGLGFIGSNFIRYIFKKHPTYKITNLDKCTYAGNPDNLKDIEDNPNYTFVKGDIYDVNSFMLERPDWVVNFAAESFVDKSIDDSIPFLQTNYVGVGKLLDWIKGTDTKFLQASSDEVYGDLKEGFAKEDYDYPLKPSSPYSASKAAAELLIQAYHRTFNIDYIITRSSNNFGPYQYPEKLIPLAITNLYTGKKVPIYGDGLQQRDWIYVIDNCRAIDLVIHKGELNNIYNIGSGVCHTNIMIIKNVIKQLGTTKDKIEYVKDRPGHDRRYALNTDKLRQLGFRMAVDRTGFYQKLSKTLDWYWYNRDWWEKLKGGE